MKHSKWMRHDDRGDRKKNNDGKLESELDTRGNPYLLKWLRQVKVDRQYWVWSKHTRNHRVHRVLGFFSTVVRIGNTPPPHPQPRESLPPFGFGGGEGGPQSKHVHREPQGTCMSPRRNWDPPPTPSPARECGHPGGTKGGGGAHSPAGEGVAESQFQRLEKKFSTLSTLACGRGGGGADSDEGTDPAWYSRYISTP